MISSPAFMYIIASSVHHYLFPCLNRSFPR